ncbi:membrane bound O-acyl transferase family-domain-containing protein [Hypoxylon sp. FL0890]|nr:membrane bound O-acyl transferase family-domain-containing protein [Hypoxylon sp. FL0890]
MAHQNADIAITYREIYHAKFWNDVEAGHKTPFLIPLHLLGVWFLPTLYLAIPHKNRPWLYQARWLVLAVVVAFNFNMILHVSSHNFGGAYGAGLIGAWGIVWNLTLLVWTKPQWEAKRVDVRRKRKHDNVASNGHSSSSPSASQNGHATKTATGEQTSRSNGAPQRNDSIHKSFEEEPDFANTTGMESNGHASHNGHSSNGLKERLANTKTANRSAELGDISEESKKTLFETIPSLRLNGNGMQAAGELEKLAAEQEFEYYWQKYPADASFWTRLDWAFDIVSTFRMTGWNWAIPCLPPYEPPSKLGNYQLPLSSVGPQRTKQGYTRELTRRALFLQRLFLIIPNYILVDFCAVYMTADPYFILGPEHNEPLPPHLASLPPLLLSAQRTALSLAGVLSALQLIFNAGALALAFLPPFPQTLRFRAHPWHLPSVTGSFTEVLDRGLAGFWGSWWHQTFRFGFAAPTQYLLREGYIKSGTPKARAVAAAFAFLSSGFLHASGSYSTVSDRSKWYLPPLFFLLAGFGTTLQSWLARAVFGTYIERLPRWARRLGNFVFVVTWMCLTSWLLVDDFGRCGLWLFEPVPFSIVRALGLGPSNDRRVWRLETNMLPRWYWGKHWWDTGLAI